jgi:hypothetical protein
MFIKVKDSNEKRSGFMIVRNGPAGHLKVFV